MAKRLRLGELLVKAGILNETQIRNGLAYQKQWGIPLGEALITMGMLSEVDLLKVLAQQLQIPAVNLAKTVIAPETLKLIKQDFALKNAVIPLGKRLEKNKEVLLVATPDPTNLNLLDELGFMSNLKVKFVVATKSSILKAIRKFYMGEDIDFEDKEDDPAVKAKHMKEKELVVVKEEKPTHGMPDLATPAATQLSPVAAGPLEAAEKKGVSKEFQALLKLLIKKGLITRTEFINELKKL